MAARRVRTAWAGRAIRPGKNRPGTQRRGDRRADSGVAGNARLTAANAAVLLVLPAARASQSCACTSCSRISPAQSRGLTGCQRRPAQLTSIGRRQRPTGPSEGLQVTSKPAPPSAAPDVLGRVLLPLRAFLGFTFCFAGLQKLANPRFFDAADPASIQAQPGGRSPAQPGPRVDFTAHPCGGRARNPHCVRRASGRRRHPAGPPGAAGRSRRPRAVRDAVPDGQLPFGAVLHRGGHRVRVRLVRRCCWPVRGRSCRWTPWSRTGPAVRRPLPGGRRGDPGPPYRRSTAAKWCSAV